MSIILTNPESRANLTRMITKRIDLNYVDGFVRIVLGVRQDDDSEGREHEIVLRAGTPEASSYIAAVSPAPGNLRTKTEEWLVDTRRINGSVA